MDLLEKQAMWVLGYLADAQLSEEVGVGELASGMDSLSIRFFVKFNAWRGVRSSMCFR